MKADVSENNALGSEGNDPDAEQRDEDIISKGLGEEGESPASHDVDLSAPGYRGEETLDSADASLITIKAYLGETYTNHIVRHSAGSHSCQTIADNLDGTQQRRCYA